MEGKRAVNRKKLPIKIRIGGGGGEEKEYTIKLKIEN